MSDTIESDVSTPSRVSAPGKAGASFGSKYDRLIAEAKKVPAAKTIVVHPCDETSFLGAVDAARVGLITPVLVGPAAKIKNVAQEQSIEQGEDSRVCPNRQRQRHHRHRREAGVLRQQSQAEA